MCVNVGVKHWIWSGTEKAGKWAEGTEERIRKEELSKETNKESEREKC